MLTLAALVDPATSPQTLATIASQRGPLLDAYLLAHPNTPGHLLRMLAEPSPSQPLTFEALTSPAATPATRARIAGTLSSSQLHAMLTAPDLPAFPELLDELVRRTLDNQDVHSARDLCLHPQADSDTQIRALHVLAASLEPVAPASMFEYAVLRHPQHLPTLLTHLTAAWADAGAEYQYALATIRDAARERDPLAAFVTSVLPNAHTSTHLQVALRRAPHPDIAGAALAESRSSRLTSVILDQVALRGTAPWRAAAYSQYMHTLPPADVELPENVTLALAQHAPVGSVGVEYTSLQPWDANPEHLRAAARATQVITVSRTFASHVARLLLHPATPADELARLRTLLDDPDVHWTGTLLDKVAPLLRDLHTPLRTLPVLEMHDDDPWIAVSLAQRVRPLLRDLAQNTDALHTALRLEPQFTGTYDDLLTTAAAITT